MTDKIWPIAFSDGGKIWASNGKFYSSTANWWELEDDNWVGETDTTFLKRIGVYRVVGVTNVSCFARYCDSSKLCFRTKANRGWKDTDWTVNNVHADAIFIPKDRMFLDHLKEGLVVKHSVAKKVTDPNWFKLSNSTCYFCGVGDCTHMTRLTSSDNLKGLDQ